MIFSARILLIAAFFVAASPARAVVHGLVMGRLTYTDHRAELDAMTFADSRYQNLGAINTVQPLRHVLIRLRAIPDAAGPLVPLDFTFVKTDGDGRFIADWIDRSRDSAATVPVAFDVIWGEPEIEDSLTILPIHDFTAPQMRFSIVPFDPAGRLLGTQAGPVVSRRIIDMPAEALLFLFDDVDAGAISDTYATAREFFGRVVDGEADRGNLPVPVLQNRMTGVEIMVGLPEPALSFTPRTDLVMLSPLVGTQDPFVVAHELGHAAVWNALGLQTLDRSLVEAPVDLEDYCFGGDEEIIRLLVPTCLNDTFDGVVPALCPCFHALTSIEHEKAAFHEGLADALAAAWLWDPPSVGTADFGVALPRAADATGRFFNVQSDVLCDGPGSDAATAGVGPNVEACHAMAMWDVMDLLPEDPITYGSQLMVFDTFDAFFDGCEANHCAKEDGVNSINHHDFRFHWQALQPDTRDPDIDAVYQQNSVAGGEL